MILTTLLILLLSIGFFSCSYAIFLLREKYKVISVSNLNLIKAIKTILKQDEYRDKELIMILERIEKLEKKQTEMRANHCLLVRRVDNIFKDKIFLTNEDFLDSLKIISEDLEKMSSEIKQIDTYQKRQNRRLKVIELNDNHICKGNWQFDDSGKIL